MVIIFFLASSIFSSRDLIDPSPVVIELLMVLLLSSNSSNLTSALINKESIFWFSWILSCISSHLLTLSFNNPILRSQLSTETSYFSLTNLFFSYSSNSFLRSTKPSSVRVKTVIASSFVVFCRV